MFVRIFDRGIKAFSELWIPCEPSKQDFLVINAGRMGGITAPLLLSSVGSSRQLPAHAVGYIHNSVSHSVLEVSTEYSQQALELLSQLVWLHQIGKHEGITVRI